MFLGRVVGRVRSTVKEENLTGKPLLLVQPVTPELQPSGRPIVCTDWTGAGSGDIIYWARSREASFAYLPEVVTTDATIIAIVDSIHVDRGRKNC